MTIDADGAVSRQRYWDVPWKVDDSLSEADIVGRAGELLDAAVRRHLIADVPVGVLLSGGLDSSALVAFMHRHAARPIHTYSVGFSDASFDELPYARLVAEAYQTRSQEVVVTPERVRELLPVYLSYIDEPYADGSAIPTYCLCELAKSDVVVVLTGEGGDEVFAGYETYAAYKAAQAFRHIPAWLRRGVLPLAANALPVSMKKLSFEFRLKRFLGGQELAPLDAHLWWRVVLTESEKRALYTPETLERLDHRPSIRHFGEVWRRTTAPDDLSRLMHVDTAVFLPDDLMIKNDRMSMAHSLEARVPMTDLELVEFMARVPSRLKLRGLTKKFILRRVLTERLPRAVVTRKKVGLEMPYSRWLASELKDVLVRYLAPDRIAGLGFLKPESVTALVEAHLEGRRDNGRALWGLLNYMVWAERYLGV
jgi:asparagine synthase (glutamine-hydrolysing)